MYPSLHPRPDTQESNGRANADSNDIQDQCLKELGSGHNRDIENRDDRDQVA